jgi:outer membrane protein TolC
VQKHLQVAHEQFRLGRLSPIDLAEAELLVVSATAKRGESIYNAKIALAQLEHATGRDVDP